MEKEREGNTTYLVGEDIKLKTPQTFGLYILRPGHIYDHLQ